MAIYQSIEFVGSFRKKLRMLYVCVACLYIEQNLGVRNRAAFK